jgi:hypothetical protein
MKTVFAIILLFLIITPLVSQSIICTAEMTSINIQNIVPMDIFGNTNYFINRGFPLKIIVHLTSPISKDYYLSVSLFDINNVPAGFAIDTFLVNEGENNLELSLVTSEYAYTGLGILHIALSNIDRSPVASFDQHIVIQILADFNRDEIVGANDISFFFTGYDFYWQNGYILSNNQECDFNKDNQLTSCDIATAIISYNFFWNNR